MLSTHKILAWRIITSQTKQRPFDATRSIALVRAKLRARVAGGGYCFTYPACGTVLPTQSEDRWRNRFNDYVALSAFIIILYYFQFVLL